MIFSNKLDIQSFFQHLQIKYCIVKLNDNFPNYYSNSDIDIFCYDIKQFTTEIITFFEKELNDGWSIKFNEINEHHIQIDFYPPNENSKEDIKLDIKFDLYSELPQWKKIKVKDSFFVYCIENAIKTENGVFIPSLINDCILRYVEFVEYYDIRADKIKHAEFIINRINDNYLKTTFFNNLYYFTKLPEEICIESEKRKEDVHRANFLKRLITKIKNVDFNIL